MKNKENNIFFRHYHNIDAAPPTNSSHKPLPSKLHTPLPVPQGKLAFSELKLVITKV